MLAKTILAQFPAQSFSLLALVLGLPLLGAFVNGVFGKRLGKDGVRMMALTALGGSFVASLATFFALLGLPAGQKLTWTAYNWMNVQGRAMQNVAIDVGFAVDPMTAVMMLVVTGVGFLIHLYSSEYMKEDPGYWRFFAYLNLFCFAMLVLIMADNLVLLFVGWEGVGLCSYLLIGFWFKEAKNAAAGKKAFIANRIGDFGLLVAIAMLIYFTGNVRFDGIANNAGQLLREVQVWPLGNVTPTSAPVWMKWLIPAAPLTVFASTLVGLALFLGCAGKSAQVPLYVWLPDAMAGPTPVSALIHAATMVTAGVYLVARMSSVFLLSPAAMAVVAVAGVITAVFAASIGLFQNDLKKVLAYSTVSQLGFMFIGVGVGAFAAGFFHVFTHAFFKACLFLGAGSVIHAMHARIHDTDQSQDMRNMGGLAKHMPLTRWTYLVSCAAIAGFPGLAGFWSKDEILWSAFSLKVVPPAVKNLWVWPPWLGQAIYWAGIVAATMTAFYMFRSYFMTFHGNFRGWKVVKGYVAPHHADHDDHHHHAPEKPGEIDGPVPHESPWPMTAPLVILATFAAFAGLLWAHPLHLEALKHLLDPVFPQSASHEIGSASKVVYREAGIEKLLFPMMLPGIGAFLVGTGAAMYIYLNRGGAPERSFQKAFPRLHGLVYDKWRIDELYDATVIGMVDALADIFTVVDKYVVDGIIATLTSVVTAALGTLLRALQTGRVQVYSAAMVVGLGLLGLFFVRPHAEVQVEDALLHQTGDVTLMAAPGLGYTYKWEGEGIKSGDFSPKRDVSFTVKPGETKKVKLSVKNAFKLIATEEVPIARPNQPGMRTAAAPEVRP